MVDIYLFGFRVRLRIVIVLIVLPLVESGIEMGLILLWVVTGHFLCYGAGELIRVDFFSGVELSLVKFFLFSQVSLVDNFDDVAWVFNVNWVSIEHNKLGCIPWSNLTELAKV